MGDKNRALFGIAVPQNYTRLPVDMGMIQSYIQRAEELGFHSAPAPAEPGLRYDGSPRDTGQ